MDATEDDVGPMEGNEFGRPVSCNPGLDVDDEDLENVGRCELDESLRYGVDATRRSSSAFAVIPWGREGLSSSRSFLILTLPPNGSAGLSMSRLFLLDPDCISTSSSAIPEDDLREWSFFFRGVITPSSRSPVQDDLGPVAAVDVDLDGLDDGEGVAIGCGKEMDGMDIDLEMVDFLSSIFSFDFNFEGRSDSSLSLSRLVLRSLVLGRL